MTSAPRLSALLAHLNPVNPPSLPVHNAHLELNPTSGKKEGENQKPGGKEGEKSKLTGDKGDKEVESEDFADEYGEMDSSGLTHIIQRFTLESGISLKNAPVRYNMWGQLNATKDNVMVVCHALTGNARLDTWWGDLLGAGKPFDTDRYLVVCCNILGSSYGTVGPTEINPDTGKPYGPDFPDVTVKDTVRIHMQTLKEALGIKGVTVAIGGSLGGMQALEWAFLGQQYGFVKSAVVMACGGRHHAWQIGISTVQRTAIMSDPNWKGGYFEPKNPPAQGLALARQIAMISYRTHYSFETKFGRTLQKPKPNYGGIHNQQQQQQQKKKQPKQVFAVENYLDYQGEKFLRRFDANCYVAVTKMMDAHDVSRGRGEYFETLRSLKTPILVIGVDSDVLYPISEQEELTKHLGNSKFVLIKSVEGHDGFLLEQTQIGGAIIAFLKNLQNTTTKK